MTLRALRACWSRWLPAACGIGLAACMRANPKYCETDMDCESGECALPARECRVLDDPGARVCVRSADCVATAPICDEDAEVCRGCAGGTGGDAECAAKDSEAPRCTDDGQCVECAADADCASEVCDEPAQSCVDATAIVYVDGDSGDDGSECTQASPCETIEGGLDKVIAGRATVKVRPKAGAEAYFEAVAIDGLTVMIAGAGASVQPLSGSAGLRVASEADVTIEGLTLRDATGGADGVRCELGSGASTLRLAGVTLKNNAGAGLSASGCTVTVRQSTIEGNDGGGIAVTGSAFTIENNVIVNNGDVVASSFGGVLISNSGPFNPQVFRFNTVARNQAPEAADSSGVDCFASTLMTATSNIVYGGFGGAPSLHGNCNWTYSDIEGSTDGMENIDSDPIFVAAAAGDYHLQAESPCLDAADPAGGTDVDIDGDARPQGAGYEMGADEVVP